jgi:hypothetical protein
MESELGLRMASGMYNFVNMPVFFTVDNVWINILFCGLVRAFLP